MKASLWRNELPAIMGLLPPLLWLGAQDPWLAPRFAFCALLVYGWQVVFALVRRQGIGLHGLVLAALLAILVPSTSPFWPLASASVSYWVRRSLAVVDGTLCSRWS